MPKLERVIEKRKYLKVNFFTVETKPSEFYGILSPQHIDIISGLRTVTCIKFQKSRECSQKTAQGTI